MKQILQSLNSGTIELVDVPLPAIGARQVRIRTTRSLLSTGTERMLMDFGRAGWIGKARRQPDKVRQVLDKVRTDGLTTTLDAVRSKLAIPLAPGYCNVGVVEKVGTGIDGGFAVGDRVASNGPHAEVVVVPRNLCARIPDAVSDDAAAFTVIGAIGLQGVRLAKPTLGECFVVTGLGLIGLMTVQLLRAHGCRVLGIDVDDSRLQLAQQFGAETANATKEDVEAVAESFSRGRGVDGVLLTLASANSEPVSQAARMCRKRGRIVLVGVTGLELSRADFYEKELTFQVSCSYGPGRYDPAYEEKGQDYPFGFVRWTEQRNFEAVLDMMASGALDMKPLITHRFAFEDAPKAYELLSTGSEPFIGILLEYSGAAPLDDRTVQLPASTPTGSSAPAVSLGVIGAGNYAGRVLIPAFRKTGANLHTIANSGGVTGVHYGRRYGFRQATTDVGTLIAHSEINAVVVATRHDSHARYVCDALRAGKHVFCEKPLALTLPELESIREAWETAAVRDPRVLMVGFNRRYSPLVACMRRLLEGVREPKSFIVTVNAGAIPREHWTQAPKIGGGRIIGEACHFVDLLRHLIGAPISSWSVQTLGRAEGVQVTDDKATITLTFEDGSFGTVHYLANGHKSFPKERIEVFCAGRVLQLDNFRVLRGFGWPGFRRKRLWRQDKGQIPCVKAFVEAARQGGPSPIPFDELMEVSRVSIEIGEAARA